MSSSAITKARPANTLAGNATTAQLFPDKANASLPVYINVPGSGRLEQKKFVVRASGSVTAAVASTVQATLLMAKVLPGTPFTPGNWTVLGATGAVAFTAAQKGNWMIEANLEFESQGGTLQGTFDSLINNTVGAAAAITNTLTGLNGTSGSVTQGSTAVAATEPVFVVAVALTFGTANAANIATLGNCVLDA